MVLRELNRLNIDIGILTESKLTHGIHTRRAFGYNVYAMEAISPHKGGVALIWRDSFSWSLESERLHGPNVVSFELRTTVHRYLVVGAYISSSEEDGSTLDYIQCAIDRRPGLRTILLGDFNVDFQNLARQAARRKYSLRSPDLALIMALTTSISLADTMRDILGNNSVMVISLPHGVIIVFLFNCPRDFMNIQIRTPHGQLSDHEALIGTIRNGLPNALKGYLHARKTILVPPSRTIRCRRAHGMFDGKSDPQTLHSSSTKALDFGEDMGAG